jgi:hypothetical protein
MPKAEDFKWPESEKVDKDAKKYMDSFESSFMTFLDQIIDLQKSSVKSSKSQLEQIYKDFMEIQDKFTASLPEQLPVLPGLPAPPFTPKEAMKEVKKFQDMSKKCFTEQADSYTDFYFKSQEQGRDVTNTVVGEVAKARNGEEKKAAAPKKKAAPAEKKAAAPKKKAAPAKEKVAESPADLNTF